MACTVTRNKYFTVGYTLREWDGYKMIRYMPRRYLRLVATSDRIAEAVFWDWFYQQPRGPQDGVHYDLPAGQVRVTELHKLPKVIDFVVTVE